MDNVSSVSQTQGVFRALSDPTRREILRMLSQQDMTITEVVGCFDITRSAVKKHLDILKQGTLISTRSRGRESINHLEPEALQIASDWLSYFSQYWDRHLNKLQHVIHDELGDGHDS